MYTPKRTPRTSARRPASYTPARPSPGRALAVAARRRLNFASSTTPKVGRVSQKTKIGFTPGSGNASRRNVINKWDAATSVALSKTLYSSDELTAIPRKTGVEVNARERDIVNLLGFTLRLCFSSTNVNSCATVRVAVVSPIDSNAVSVAEFFRGYDDKRNTDFTSTKNSSELLYSPINRDKYVVLWEKKLELGPYGDAPTSVVIYSRSKDSYKQVHAYVPLNRQLRYNGSAQSDCADKVFLVYWYDNPTAVGSATGVNYIKCQRWAAAHWRDP